MKISVKYFASLRDQTGKSEETLETQAKNGLELFQELKQKYDFSLETKHISCLLYTSPSPRDKRQTRMPSSA